MIRVLVAEDEQPILRSICNMIEKVNSNYQIVGKVSNGQQAIDFLERENVNVIFLDINMPVVDGIQVLQRIKELELEIFAVILSGYQNFEYARNALQYGAIEYLLKPLKKNELEKTLLEIEKKILESKKNRTQKYLQGDNIKESKSDALYGECTYLACVNIGPYSEKVRNDERLQKIRLTEQLFTQNLRDKIGVDKFWLVQGKQVGELILFIQPDVLEIFTRLESCLLAETEGVLPITILLQTKITTLPNIKDTYLSLREQMKPCIYYGKSNCIISKKVKEIDWETVRQSLFQEGLNRITMTSSRGDISRIFENLIVKTNNKQILIEEGIKLFIHHLYQKIPSTRDYFTIEESMIEAIEECECIEFIRQRFLRVMDDCFLFTEHNRTKRALLAQEVKQFIEKNYAFDLSGQYLAEKFGFVPIYLREIFKKEWGISPNEYLYEVRMNRAKELLGVGELVKDVASAVGYQDPLYFSKLFKKNTGVSPSDYMQYLELECEKKMCEE